MARLLDDLFQLLVSVYMVVNVVDLLSVKRRVSRLEGAATVEQERLDEEERR